MFVPQRRIARLAMTGVGVLAVVGGVAIPSNAATGRPGDAGSSLHVVSNQHLPHSTSTARLVSAEASNGDVAVAVPAGVTNDDIEIARSGHAPTLFLTVPAGTRAMAFDHSDLFIAGPHAISSVDRATGTVIRTWELRTASEAAVVGSTLAYGDGRLWVLGTTGNGRKVFEIQSGAAGITSVGSGHHVATIAVGSRGVYFVRGGGHTLVRVSASGHQVTAPTHEKVSETLSGPEAVEAIVVDGKDRIVGHDYGQGFDAGIVRYNAKTLAHLGVAGTNVALTAVVPTVEGNLVLMTGVGQGACPAHHSCVAKISTTTAKTTDKVQLPGGDILSVLLGPDPAVVVAHSHHADLLRLS
jgi:hypothetical protein